MTRRSAKFSTFIASAIGVLLFVLSIENSFAQQMMFNNIPFNDALPSNETYHVFQDRKGYMWIATEQGLCRLDGQEVKIFNEKNGLPEKAIYAVKEHNESIWMVSSKNRILILKDGVIKEHPLSKKYQNLITTSDEFTYDINFSKEIIMNTKLGSYILDTLQNTVKRIPISKNTSSIQLKTEGFVPYTALINWTIKDITLIANFTDKPIKTIKIPFKGIWGYRYSTGKINNNYFFAYNRQLIKVDQNLKVNVYTTPGSISCIYVDRDKDLWVGQYNKGLLFYPQGKIKNPTIGLPNLSIASIYQDREKNIWCTTLERGVFMTRSKSIINYAEKLGNTYPQSLIKAVGNNVLVLKGESSYAIDSERKINSLQDITPSDRVGRELSYLMKHHHQLFRTLNMSDFLQFGKNVFYAISYVNLHRIDGNKISKYLLPSPGRCIANLNNHTLLVGCNDGVYQFETKDTIWTKVVATPSRVTKIFETVNKDYLIATNGNGVYYLRNNKLYPFHLPAEIVYDITQDPNGTLWFATNKGVIKKLKSSEIIRYTVLNGLPANAVSKLAINNQQIYLTTSAGLITFPLTANLQNQEKMPIYLRSASVGKTAIDFNQPVQLSYNQNSIILHIDALSFKNSKGQLKYNLSPGSNNYRYTTSNQIILENLVPNSYTLTLFGMNSDGFLSDPLVLKFQISSPFWQKGWFIMSTLLIATIIIVVVVKTILYRIRRKEEEKTSMNKLIAESRLAALQAQMNPHFVFNSINSIQNYILKKQEDKACDYLAQFSQLIRLVLQHSETRMISLAEELKLLALYISLEQLRFGNSFDYEILLDEKINPNLIYLPSMLIQPYFENAIWHGLMPLKEQRKGKLTLKVTQNNHQLLISVEDNGIGRKKSMEYKSADIHRPMALKLNQQRINTLNLMFKKEAFKIAITDKYDQNGEATGTLIVISIPLDYE